MFLMRRLITIFVIVLTLGIVGTAPKAFAVTSLEISVVDDTNTAKPEDTITLIDDEGNTVREDDRDDKTGIWFWDNIKPGDYTIHSGDRVIDHVQVVDGETTRITVNPTYLGVFRFPNLPNVTFGVDVGLRGFVKFGNFDGTIKSPFGDGEDELDLTAGGLALDLFLRSPMVPFFIGFALGTAVNAEERGVEKDFHPPVDENDSYVEISEGFFWRFLIGATLLRLKMMELDVMTGVQGMETEVKVFSNESEGGGEEETFKDSKHRVGPVLGMMAKFSLPNMVRTFIYVSYVAAYFDSLKVEGVSGKDFRYSGEWEAGWQNEGSFGIMFRF